MQGELYLNPELSQVGLQLLRVLKMNGLQTKLAGAFKVQGPVVDEDAFFRRTLCNFERDLENRGFRLARMDVTGAEKHEKVAAEFECFDAVFVEFERLVVDGADEIFLCVGNRIQNFARARKGFGLRIHEGNELFARKRARAIEESAVKILFHRDLATVKGRKRKVVAVGELLPIEMKRFGRDFAGLVVPAVRQNDSANVPENCIDAGQGLLHRADKVKMRARHQTIHENLEVCLLGFHYKRPRAGEAFQVAVRWKIE